MGLMSRTHSLLQSSDLYNDGEGSSGTSSPPSASVASFSSKRTPQTRPVRRRARPIAPPCATGYLRLLTTPTTGFFRAARRTRARVFFALDGLTGELIASHTPRHPPMWTLRVATARLVAHDADCRIDVDEAPGAPRRSTCSLVAESRADYYRWKTALEAAVALDRALRDGGPADIQFRKVYRVRDSRSSPELPHRANAGAGPQLVPCVHKITGAECVASKVMCTDINTPIVALRSNSVSPLVPLQDIFPANDAAIEVAPAYPLGTLGDLLQRTSHQLSIPQVASFSRDIFSALLLIHGEGLVHRLVTPHSIVVSAETRDESRDHPLNHSQENDSPLLTLRLGSFDYACAEGDITPESPSARPAAISSTAAPEVLLCEQYGSPADMWSTGVLLYRMLTGEDPFIARSELELIRAIETLNYTFTPAHRMSIPASGIDLVGKLLVRSPSLRLTAAQALEHPFIRDIDDQFSGRVILDRASPSTSSALSRNRFSQQNAPGNSSELTNDLAKAIFVRDDNDDRAKERSHHQTIQQNPFTGFRRTHGSLDQRHRVDDVTSCQHDEVNSDYEECNTFENENSNPLGLTLPASLTSSSGEIGAALLARLDYGNDNKCSELPDDIQCEQSLSHRQTSILPYNARHSSLSGYPFSRFDQDMSAEKSEANLRSLYFSFIDSERYSPDYVEQNRTHRSLSQGYKRLVSDLGPAMSSVTTWKDDDFGGSDHLSALEASDCTGSPISGQSPSMDRDRDCSDRIQHRPSRTRSFLT